MTPAPVSILPLDVRHLDYSAGGRLLINDISFEIESGATTLILGPNGAGKSLLLRLCHGLLRPTEGEVRWRSPGGVSAGHKRHGMVFQKPVMLRRSAAANIRHALSAAGIGGEDARERIRMSLERFGLRELADQPARLLSAVNSSAWRLPAPGRCIPRSCFWMNRPPSLTPPRRSRSRTCCSASSRRASPSS